MVRFSWVIPLSFGWACTAPDAPAKEDGEEGLTDSLPGDSAGDSAIDTEDPATGDGTITGIVTVSLYTTDANGDREALDWDEVYGPGRFPFGDIFVAAYTVTDEGAIVYHDDYVVYAPDHAGSPFSLKIDPDEADSVYVYAVLDYWGDGILSPNEPLGVWPDAIEIEAGEETSGVEIPIVVPYYNFDGGGGGIGDGSTGGPWVTISGDVDITVGYAGGTTVTMLYDNAGLGPYYMTSFSPVPRKGGADASYEMTVGANFGTSRLVAAWDANYNGLIDPSDKWGGYVNAEGTSGNPIVVGDSDMPGMNIELPFGNENSSIVPFHTVSGTLTLRDGAAAYDAGTEFYIGALKYRPDTTFTVDEMKDAYDYSAYTPASFVGDSVNYMLIVPSNTITYVWAYADLDADGNLHEDGEPLGAPSNESGKVSTGTDNVENLNVTLTFPDTPE